jgi:hypothetical protein
MGDRSKAWCLPRHADASGSDVFANGTSEQSPPWSMITACDAVLAVTAPDDARAMVTT